MFKKEINLKGDEILIAAFDIGCKNFSFTIEKISQSHLPKSYNDLKKSGEIILASNNNLIKERTSYISKEMFISMIDVLDLYKNYWDLVSYFVIEQQMSFGKGKSNTMAVKLGQHCYSYFLLNYGELKEIVEYPSYNKTQILGAPKGLKSKERKKWSVEQTISLLSNRNETEVLRYLQSQKKKDDISDCIMMTQAYKLTDLKE